MKSGLSKGFTLIELLIVVAIIAILAAIAVPNFLEAQTRAKVSRAKADIRSMATALEAYALDNNKYPIDGWNVNGGQDTQAYWYLPGGSNNNGPGGVTSPIAYLSSAQLIDPFRTMADAQAAYDTDAPDSAFFTVHDYRRYRYSNWKYTYVDGRAAPGLPDYFREYSKVYGAWRLNSSGPDRVGGHPTAYPPPTVPNSSPAMTQYCPYDSTNGTISVGEIMRSQKYTEQILIGSN